MYVRRRAAGDHPTKHDWGHRGGLTYLVNLDPGGVKYVTHWVVVYVDLYETMLLRWLLEYEGRRKPVT